MTPLYAVTFQIQQQVEPPELPDSATRPTQRATISGPGGVVAEKEWLLPWLSTGGGEPWPGENPERFSTTGFTSALPEGSVYLWVAFREKFWGIEPPVSGANLLRNFDAPTVWLSYYYAVGGDVVDLPILAGAVYLGVRQFGAHATNPIVLAESFELTVPAGGSNTFESTEGAQGLMTIGLAQWNVNSLASFAFETLTGTVELIGPETVYRANGRIGWRLTVPSSPPGSATMVLAAVTIRPP